MKRLRMCMLAARIEWNWEQIRRNRRRMNELIARKEPYSSPKLCRLDAQTVRLAFFARKMEARYRALSRTG